MSIIIIFIIFNVVLLATARYTAATQNVLSQPLYTYILWHMLLFSILSAIFYESRHGFKRVINIFSWFFYFFERSSKKKALDYAVWRYRESSEKVYLSRVFIGVAITLSIAFILYSELVFFSVVVSDSMSPEFNRGDMVLIQNIIGKPEVGDIITARVPDTHLPVMHRVVSISGGVIRTKGDRNPAIDSWSITQSQVLGKSVDISGRPVVIPGVGEYFIVDASGEGKGKTYGPEFDAVAKLIRGVKAAGLMIFSLCLVLYLIFSIREARRTRW